MPRKMKTKKEIQNKQFLMLNEQIPELAKMSKQYRAGYYQALVWVLGGVSI